MADKQVSGLTSSTPTLDDLTVSFDNADTSELKKTTWQSVRDLFKTYFDTIYQAILVSGTNIKTINGNSVLGSGDLTITASANIPVKDEGTTITSAVSSFNFVGSGVTATNVGSDVTVTISSGGGSGDVVGPASSTDSVPVLFSGTTGKLIKNSTPTGTGNPVLQTSPTLTTPSIASIKGTLKADTDGATITFDKNVSDFHAVTLGGNRTLALSNMATGDRIVLRLQQDATGSRVPTFFTTIKWAGGSAPTLTTTPSKADMFGFLCTSAGNYDGFILGQNI